MRLRKLGVLALFSCIAAVAVSRYLFGHAVSYSNSVFHVLSFCAIFFFARQRYLNQPLREMLRPSIGIPACILALFLVVGQAIEAQDSVRALWASAQSLLDAALKLVGIGFLFAMVLHALFRGLEAQKVRELPAAKENGWFFRVFFAPGRLSYLCLWGLIFAAWLPVLLAYYPGIHSYDVSTQFQQAAGKIPLSNHHPIAHTLFIRLMLQAGEWTGNRYYTILAYSVTQMAFLSAVYAYTARALDRISAPKWLLVLSLLHFALNPYISVFSMLETKDAISGGAFLWVHALLLEFIFPSKAAPKKRWFPVCLAGALLLTLLFRNQSVYAFLLYLPFAYFLLRRKDIFWAILIPCALMMFLYPPLYRAFGVADAPDREALCVPVQQMARVAALHEAELPPGDLEKIRQWISYERYNPRLADPVKDTSDYLAFQEDALGYTQLWLKYLATYPVDYLDAFLNLNLAFWYTDANLQGPYYSHGYLETRLKSSAYTGGFVVRSSQLPWLLAQYERFFWGNGYDSTPLVAVLYSIGLPIQLIVLALAFCFRRKRYALLLMLLSSLFLWLVFACGPIALGRYIFSFVVMYPLYIACMVIPARDLGEVRQKA